MPCPFPLFWEVITSFILALCIKLVITSLSFFFAVCWNLLFLVLIASLILVALSFRFSWVVCITILSLISWRRSCMLSLLSCLILCMICGPHSHTPSTSLTLFRCFRASLGCVYSASASTVLVIYFWFVFSTLSSLVQCGRLFWYLCSLSVSMRGRFGYSTVCVLLVVSSPECCIHSITRCADSSAEAAIFGLHFSAFWFILSSFSAGITPFSSRSSTDLVTVWRSHSFTLSVALPAVSIGRSATTIMWSDSPAISPCMVSTSLMSTLAITAPW